MFKPQVQSSSTFQSLSTFWNQLQLTSSSDQGWRRTSWLGGTHITAALSTSIPAHVCDANCPSQQAQRTFALTADVLHRQPSEGPVSHSFQPTQADLGPVNYLVLKWGERNHTLFKVQQRFISQPKGFMAPLRIHENIQVKNWKKKKKWNTRIKDSALPPTLCVDTIFPPLFAL